MFTARSSTRAALAAAAALIAVVSLASCAQEESTPTTAAEGSDACVDITTVTDGKITVATSDPAFPPYVIKNDPTNQEGFEAATAYAVAEAMGFSADDVEWTFTGFNKLFAPGEKDFDFAINQVGITPEREQAVTFSEPYYEAANAVLTLESSEFADVTTLSELQDAKIGVQVNTTAQQQVEDEIAPTQSLAVYDDSSAAVQALQNGQIDVFVTDLPTTLYLATVEVDGGVVVGQLPGDTVADRWGLVLQKDNALVSCVDQALGELTDSGDLQAITDEWMTEYSKAPVLG